MVNYEQEKLIELKKIEASYEGLDKSISDLDEQISKNPYNQALKQKRENLRITKAKAKLKAEELRKELGKPIEEEDALN